MPKKTSKKDYSLYIIGGAVLVIALMSFANTGQFVAGSKVTLISENMQKNGVGYQFQHLSGDQDALNIVSGSKVTIKGTQYDALAFTILCLSPNPCTQLAVGKPNTHILYQTKTQQVITDRLELYHDGSDFYWAWQQGGQMMTDQYAQGINPELILFNQHGLGHSIILETSAAMHPRFNSQIITIQPDLSQYTSNRLVTHITMTEDVTGRYFSQYSIQR